MADNLVFGQIQELDQYIRMTYTLRASETPTEFDIYTKLAQWDTDGAGMFLPLMRKLQGRQADPMEQFDEEESISYQKTKKGRTKDLQDPVMFATGISFSLKKMKMGIARLSSTKNVMNMFADSVRLTREYYFAPLLNDAESASAPEEMIGYDGKPPVATDHPLQGGGTWSNYYGLVSGVTYNSLNAMVHMIGSITDEEGNPYPMFKANKLYIPDEEELNAYETLKSAGRPDVLSNAENVLDSRRHFALSPSGVVVLNYMTNDRWFLCDDAHYEVERYELLDTGVEGPFVDEIYTKSVAWNQVIWIKRAVWDPRGIVMAKRA